MVFDPSSVENTMLGRRHVPVINYTEKEKRKKSQRKVHVNLLQPCCYRMICKTGFPVSLTLLFRIFKKRTHRERQEIDSLLATRCVMGVSTISAFLLSAGVQQSSSLFFFLLFDVNGFPGLIITLGRLWMIGSNPLDGQ